MIEENYMEISCKMFSWWKSQYLFPWKDILFCIDIYFQRLHWILIKIGCCSYQNENFNEILHIQSVYLFIYFMAEVRNSQSEKLRDLSVLYWL